MINTSLNLRGSVWCEPCWCVQTSFCWMNPQVPQDMSRCWWHPQCFFLGSIDIQICHPPGHLDVANVSWLGDYLLLGWLPCVPFLSFSLWSLLHGVGNSYIIHHSEGAGWQAILAKTLNILTKLLCESVEQMLLAKAGLRRNFIIDLFFFLSWDYGVGWRWDIARV